MRVINKERADYYISNQPFVTLQSDFFALNFLATQKLEYLPFFKRVNYFLGKLGQPTT